MKIRRLSAALLAAGLGATVLAGAAPASASVSGQAGVTSAMAGSRVPAPLLTDYLYLSGPYQTMDACWVAHRRVSNSGKYTVLYDCRWYEADQQRSAGYYFLVYYVP
ncbi:hypothetical protein ACFQ08_02195 [Streptosporangium algeriense]|uniref:Uncharacterized protein n=1 Tax=Streptosporangium algeriense TaxID=1682748 RepID=A0ABW3DKT6_9ACTN